MNYYELLKIENNADDNQIKRAYFSSVKLHSPDSDPEGFKAIRTAYETLSDKKKRAEYDLVFSAGGNIQKDLFYAYELIRENKYKQAEEFLRKQSKGENSSPEIKRLLADVLWTLKKTGSAEKICEELIRENPSDGETFLLYAQIADSRGHKTKARDLYENAVIIDPLNSKTWIKYASYALRNCDWQIPNIVNQAIKHNINMFQNDYILYLAVMFNPIFPFSDDYIKYFDKFAEFFIEDKNHDEGIYKSLMRLMPRIIEREELIPFLIKIFPVIEKSQHRSEENNEDIKYIKAAILSYKIYSDKRIHEVVADLTGSLLYGEEEKKERLTLESYIVFNMSLTRPSIKILMNEYPECYKLHQNFYNDVLNEKKTEHLTNKYIGLYKKMKPGIKGIPTLTTHPVNVDDYDDSDETKQFIRETPKVGRNDPCPCGSGKKYKKCCG